MNAASGGLYAVITQDAGELWRELEEAASTSTVAGLPRYRTLWRGLTERQPGIGVWLERGDRRIT